MPLRHILDIVIITCCLHVHNLFLLLDNNLLHGYIKGVQNKFSRIKLRIGKNIKVTY